MDLLVLGAGSLAALSQASTHAAAETVVERGETLTPLVYGASQLYFPSSYLVWSALRDGREVYAMDEIALRRQTARGLLRKAGRLLHQASDSLEDGSYELAIAGGYTAAEHAAKGLLMLKPGVNMPGSHGGVAQMFGREYVRTGEVPAEWSDLLQQKLELRSRAMYDYQLDPAADEAARTLDFAGELIAFLQQKLAQVQPDETAPGEPT
ncbi:MAG: HEPN domain-containing protein [Chloroflexi bacterium]|nr:HEPN domain-containing protein [Chloroflexota bacterium]